jgi:hypothetical protein
MEERPARVLDPVERVSEVIFGLLMAIMFRRTEIVIDGRRRRLIDEVVVVTGVPVLRAARSEDRIASGPDSRQNRSLTLYGYFGSL